jgi:NAD(P)-dependent dehydrogenase (short-subunit alcohol dehydrogenase family)
MDLRFDDKTILVTGGSGGIGAEIARGFAEAGGDVVVHYAHRADVASSVVGSLAANGSTPYAVQVDLTEPDGSERLLAAPQEMGGPALFLASKLAAFVREWPVARGERAQYQP